MNDQTHTHIITLALCGMECCLHWGVYFHTGTYNADLSLLWCVLRPIRWGGTRECPRLGKNLELVHIRMSKMWETIETSVKSILERGVTKHP